MIDDKFEKILSWAQGEGAKLNNKVVRKCVDGVWGMFATDEIVSGEVLASFPLDRMLKVDDKYHYPENATQHIKLLHTIACELVKSDNQWPGLSDLYELEDMKANNVYFYTKEELALLKEMNHSLYDYADVIIKEINVLIDYITKIDASLNTEVGKQAILRGILNYDCRAWNDGFVPVLDMFNHSDKLGNIRRTDKKHTHLTASFNHKKGDQIFISYGQKDMFLHAINYGYFDPAGTHCIDIGFRITQSASADYQKHVFNYIKGKYDVLYGTDAQGVVHFKLKQGIAMLLDYAPNVNTIDFLRDLSYASGKELKSKQYDPIKLRGRMLQCIDVLLGANKVESFSLDDVPEKLHYFYHMLQKERKILLRNRDWVLTNSPPAASSFGVVKQR